MSHLPINHFFSVSKTVEDMQRLGILVDSIAGALYSPSDSAAGTVANTLSPAIVYEIGQHFKEEGTEGSAEHILAQTLVAAATASLAGNDALSAGFSAGGAEVIAPILADWMYDKNPQDLTSEEKNTISAIISLGSAAVGATTGNTTDVISSSVAGTTAVEDNRLTKQQASIEFANRVKKCVESGRSAKDCGESIHMIGVGLNPDGSYSSYYIKDEKTGQIYADPVYSKENPPTFYVNENGYTIITTPTTGNDYIAISLGLYFVGINYAINTNNGNAYFGYSLAGSSDMFKPILGANVLTGTIYSHTTITDRGETTDNFLKGFSISATGCYIGCAGVNKSFDPNNVGNIGNEDWAVEYGVGAGVSAGVGEQFGANQ